MDSSFQTWHSRERRVRHHRRAEAADWRMAELKDIELMFCIQTYASEKLEEHVACAKCTDYYPSLRGAHASTSNAIYAAGVPEPWRISPKYSHVR